MKFTNLVDPSLVIITTDLCLGVEKNIFKEIMHFHYMTYMVMPQHKNPCVGGNEINNFGRHFLGHHKYILGLSDLCLGVEKKIFKQIMHLKNICPKNAFIKFHKRDKK